MPDFSAAVLNPVSGEIALNMKQLIDDNMEHSRRRASNDSDFDKAMNQVTISAAQDAQIVKHLAQLNVLNASQTGQTENQAAVDPIRTGSGDAIAAVPGVAAGVSSVSAAAVAASLGNLASALVPIITAAGGVVTAQTLAAMLPVVVNAVGGASTPSQTQPKPAA